METTHLVFFAKKHGHMYILVITYCYGLVFHLGNSCVEFVKSSPPIFYKPCATMVLKSGCFFYLNIKT